MAIFSQFKQTISHGFGGSLPAKIKWKAALIRLLLAIIAIVSIMATRRYIFRYSHNSEEQESADAFAKMYYPIMDKLYASGDFEALQEEIHRLQYQEGASAISEWSHLPVLHYYTRGTMVTQARDALKDGSDDLSILSNGVWAALMILYRDDHFESNEIYSEADREMIRSFRKESSELLMKDLSLTSKQITALHDSCLNKYEDVKYDEVEKYVKEYYENDRKFMIPE